MASLSGRSAKYFLGCLDDPVCVGLECVVLSDRLQRIGRKRPVKVGLLEQRLDGSPKLEMISDWDQKAVDP